MKKEGIFKHLDFFILDIVITIISFVIAYYLYSKNYDSLFISSDYSVLLFVIVLIGISFCYFTEPYSGILKRAWYTEIKELTAYSIYSLLVLSSYLFFSKSGATYSRVTITLFYLIYFLLSFPIRILWKKLVKNKKLNNQDILSLNKLLVITSEKDIEKVIKNINEDKYSTNIVDSICVIDKDYKGKKIDKYEVKTNSEDVLSYICQNWVDEVLIATDDNKVPSNIFIGLAQAGVTTGIITSTIKGFEDCKQKIEKRFGYTTIFSSIAYRSTYQQFIKRLMDVVGGLVGCLITLLLIIIIGPIIYIKSPGPIFYKQERIGQNGRRFKMYKFRSMIINADGMKEQLMSQNRIKDGMMFKMDNDPRIIPGIGKFIRQTSLDEFPQFINVLIGDMSLVGTRPPTVDEWVKYKLEHRIRMAIKPGITGLWQTNGRSKITDFNKVIEYDTKYINDWTIGLDVEILFKTIVVLFSKREDEAM